MPEEIRLKLPFPPSLNRLYRRRKWSKGARGPAMYRSPQYQSWLKQAGLSYLAQRPALSCKSITGPYNLRLVLYPPDKRLRDTDNFGLKPINDFLQAMGIVSNDRLQRDIHVSPRQPDGEARVEVIVTGVSS